MRRIDGLARGRVAARFEYQRRSSSFIQQLLVLGNTTDLLFDLCSERWKQTLGSMVCYNQDERDHATEYNGPSDHADSLDDDGK